MKTQGSTSEVLEYLAQLVEWWREQRENPVPIGASEERPVFKGPRDATKTVRLSEPMARAAESYARKHRAQTGGTFSGLCEWLIWQALGRPEKFVAQENTE
jgi:predicted solute-binding protein